MNEPDNKAKPDLTVKLPPFEVDVSLSSLKDTLKMTVRNVNQPGSAVDISVSEDELAAGEKE